jgi:catechol 2,3-dioxygenase-like lactoylglutathione lyase family enzyme
MSTTQLDATTAMQESAVAAVPMRFEVTALPVADVDRAKAFYQRLGWRLDIDFKPTKNSRGVQFTPPGSPASIQFGEGLTTMTEPLQGLLLVVDDIDVARDELIGHRRRRQRDLAPRPGQGPGAGPGPRAPLVLQPGVLRRPRQQPVAAPGGHGAAPGPGVSDECCGSCPAPARDGRAFSSVERGGGAWSCQPHARRRAGGRR